MLEGSSSLCDDDSDQTELVHNKIEHLIKDTNEISRLLQLWQSQQTEELSNVPWTEEDKLRKSISDLVETEADYVRVCLLLVLSLESSPRLLGICSSFEQFRLILMPQFSVPLN